MEKRALVTGGAGFLGSHLCKKLIRQGWQVICLDNFFTGAKHHIKDLQGQPQFELIRHDIIQPIRLEVDLIFNLACPASPQHYQHNPVATTKTSVMGALNMLGLAKRLGIPMLQASSSEVYGDPLVHPQPETYWGNVNPFGLRSCYDEGKRCAEALCFDYQRQHDISVKIARIFNTFGPNMHPADGRVISNFIVNALKGKDLTIYGDGTHSRSFCFVDDMLDGLLKLAFHPSFLGPVNLGNPNEMRIIDLAELIKDLTNTKSRLIFAPLPQDDPQKRCPDISLAQKNLGWQPKVGLEDGLKSTIQYFDELLSNPQLKTVNKDP